MIERKIIADKKNEYAIKEYTKKSLGKGKATDIKIERTPVGERIIVYTTRPGIIIGSRGESIQHLTKILQTKFKLENPKVEVMEVTNPEFDARTVADNIALSLERFGPNSFKMRAYRELERLKSAGALGAEIVLSGKLPSEKAKKWRFSYGYLQKTGEINIVNKADATALTKPGVVGIKVSIVPKDAVLADKINTIMPPEMEIAEEIVEEKPKKKRTRKKKEQKEEEKENGDHKNEGN